MLVYFNLLQYIWCADKCFHNIYLEADRRNKRPWVAKEQVL